MLPTLIHQPTYTEGKDWRSKVQDGIPVTVSKPATPGHTVSLHTLVRYEGYEGYEGGDGDEGDEIDDGDEADKGG